MKKKIVAAVLSGALAGGILVSAGPIMADTANANQQTKPAVMEMRCDGVMKGHMAPGFMGKGQEGMSTILDELVADGTINQAKADQISSFITQKEEDTKAQWEEMKNMTPEERAAAREDRAAEKNEIRDKKGGILTELVDEKIINQDEADAIQEKQQGKMTAQREEMAAKQQAMMDDKFNQWVAADVISEDQADQIKDFLANKAEERKAQMDKLQNMTDEERKSFMEENKNNNKDMNILDEMVDQGIISQEQAQKIAEEMPKADHFGFGHRNWDSVSQEQE
ncbi:hypothetical protein [Dehalobacterium formicoaceticum]|uniref:Uncharacterized protein n=1 Tax=Dehalobacterium formicoaceticum TaxID=51515 RepID=A0ABT1Y5Y7_9FIRM|nr:hypothetical protein [Dehalobacterium formicoaceticum]MCR6546282.1 hypothetical protein [Dehalobacterium formicoaceticum]